MAKQPKYQMVKDGIKSNIVAGNYEVGEKIPTESELMEIYSVSRHTVRLAISSLVNEGMLKRVQGSGTYVSPAPTGTPGKHYKAIGVVTTYLSDYIFPSIIRGIEEELSAKGYSMILASTQNDTENERKSLEMMLQHHVDGLIVEPTKSSYINPNLDLYQHIKLRGIPLLYLHSCYPEISAPVVRMDDVKATELAAQHLIELGHRNIALITKTDDSQGKERLKGFIHALEAAKIPLRPDLLLMFETQNQEQVKDQIAGLLQQAQPPTAIVSYNDQAAMAVLQAAHEQQLHIPEDLSLVSHDDSFLSTTNGTIPLTSVPHPQEKMGKDAARSILKAIQNPERRRSSIIYQPELLVRQSTAKPIKK